MNLFNGTNFIDEEVNELYDSFNKTSGSLNDLYNILIEKELDKRNHDMNAIKHNKGLLFNNPDYEDIDEHSTVYMLLKRIIDLSSFSNISDFNNFIEYLINNKHFKMLENLSELTMYCFNIISIDGMHCAELSEYSIPYANKLNDLIPDYLDEESYGYYKSSFPDDLTKYDGVTINDLYMYIWELEHENVIKLRKDLLRDFKIDFNIFDETLNKDTLELFVKTVRKCSTNGIKKVKK